MRLYRLAGIFFLACFLFFAATTAITKLLPRHHGPVPADLAEEWRPDLANVRSMDEAMRVVPAYIAREQGSPETRVTRGIDRFVRDRFFHGTSLIGYRRNWLAAMAGLLWINLREPVVPDSILHHRRAICSQQAIVFMALLKRYDIHYAAVLMSWPSSDPLSRGHFAVAARVDGRWLYFDTDQEAQQVGVPVEGVIDGSALPALYGNKPELLAHMRYAAAHHQITLAHFDQDPAPRGGLFQRVTEWMSAYGWLIFGLLSLIPFLLIRRRSGTFFGPALPA